MKVYLAIKYHTDLSNRLLIEAILDGLEAAGFTTACALRDIEAWGEVRVSASDLMRYSFELIDSSDLILIELSEKGVGLGIEAGYAYAQRKRIITVLQTARDVSTPLEGIANQVFFYNDLTQLNLYFASLAADR